MYAGYLVKRVGCELIGIITYKTTQDRVTANLGLGGCIPGVV